MTMNGGGSEGAPDVAAPFDDAVRRATWRQFGAAIDMLRGAIRACPDDAWTARLWLEDGEPSRFSAYWYLCFHTLFWLDLYLTGSVDGFAPPPPYGLEELDPAGVLPNRVYTRAELEAYLDHCRAKCIATIESLDGAAAARVCAFPWGEVTRFELLLYTMRHVQEHAAQLLLALGARGLPAPGWVGVARPA
jgi:hypothetical protein